MPSSSALDRGHPRRNRRRRKSESSDEDEGALPPWKAWMVIAILILCFAVLYPSLFHPMLVSLFSRGQQPQSQPNLHQRPPIHPAMNSPRASAGPRADIHPPMRMAPQAEAPAASGKGFAWMLPMYTVGVVAFLVYTLFKSKKRRKARRMRYTSDDEFESETDEESEREGRMGKRQLHDLQARLKETEMAMSKILEQINAVSKSEKVAAALSNTQGDVKAQEAQAHAQTKEGYVRDLESALRQFKQLSDTYDKGQEKPKAAKRQYSDYSEEEDDDIHSTDEMIDEEEEQTNQEVAEEIVDHEKDHSEVEVPEEPEHQPVEEPVPTKKRLRRRQRRT